MSTLGDLMNEIYMRQCGVRYVSFRTIQFFVQTPPLPLSVCVIMEKTCTVSEPQFLHLKQRNNKTHFAELE